MKSPQAPPIDPRRRRDFSAELQERARAWIPAWAFADAERDFGRALLEIAAGFNSEVTERLDNAGEKMRRGFLDWLGVRGEAARPARMPVVLKLAANATEGVLARVPVSLQVDADETQVIFETESDVFVVPGRLDVVIGADADADAFYLPPLGLSNLDPLEPLPTQWQLKSFAASGAATLQLDPDIGLKEEMILEASGKHYRITKVDNGIVTIEPRLETDILEKTIVRNVTTFDPFDGITRNRQEHALYIGDSEVLNIESAATIDVVGAQTLRTGFTWQYWGKVKDSDEPSWHPLTEAPTQKADAIVLTKPEGPIEEKAIDEINSRWIRATTNNIADPNYSFTVDALKLKINASGNPQCPRTDKTIKGIESEGMVNNTPLVLSEPFFPLGSVPRQFDAFYLGSAEAFSKKGAVAQVCFELADATCRVYSAIAAGAFANEAVLAGVGNDNSLHLVKLTTATGTMTRFRGPLRPPLPSTVTPRPTQTSPIDLNPLCRPLIWSVESDFFVAVAAGADIWVWHEKGDSPKDSGWNAPIKVPDFPGRPADIQDILMSVGPGIPRPGAVLSNGRFLQFDGVNWNEPRDSSGERLRDYASIAPVYDEELVPTNSVIGIGAMDKKLYRIDGTIAVKETLVGGDNLFDVGEFKGGQIPVGGIRPAAYNAAGDVRIVGVNAPKTDLIAISTAATTEANLEPGAEITGGAVMMTKVRRGFEFAVSVRRPSESSSIAIWSPNFVTGNPVTAFETEVSGATGELGTPLVIERNLVVPGSNGDAFVAPYNPDGRLPFTKVIREGFRVPTIGGSAPPFEVGDFLTAFNEAGGHEEWEIKAAPMSRDADDVLYIIESASGSPISDDDDLIGYTGAGLTGEIKSNVSFKVDDPIDPHLVPGARIRVKAGTKVRFCDVESVDEEDKLVIVTAAHHLPATSGEMRYWIPVPSRASVLPVIEFDTVVDLSGTTTLLETARFYFPSPVDPSSQQALTYSRAGTTKNAALLTKRWIDPPPLTLQTDLIIDAAIGAWRQQLADTRSNPALSWEYWNGKGWWSLEITDGTARLASSGPVEFKIPDDIAESDWAGKTNFWIRARLVGGDYGQEEVSVVTGRDDLGNPEQKVVRSTENIRAPQVLDLQVSYSISKEVLPTYVLAQDSGSIVDQSDANRTKGAIVEAFIPLAQTLGRLSGPAPEVTPTEDCPPDCDCEESSSPSTRAASGTTSASRSPITPATGRFMFIGLDATLSDGPVNVLLLVDKENDHTAFAPMTVEALSAERRFTPIVTEDTTRALGESGILSMSFPVSPTLGELFGNTRTWLRLTPKSAAQWTPSIRGAYLNAVYAAAKETLTREPVGSADGSPNLTVRLARPPVLRDTLELRVREPLGEEEREALIAIDANLVVSDPEGLTGDWVLWREVLDPDDAGPSDRVYALDDETGEIRFGDGIHGRIPPIGVDSIVAFGYSRTEGSRPGSETVAANWIKPRTPVNLVTPVESVESVIAADQSAGGAPPETDERVLRFGFARLRHRDRAITAKDIEDLTLQSSPDIAQAKVVVRQRYVRLTIVMKGKDVTPNAAQKRELRRALLEVSPISLSSNRALQINGPGIRKLRVELLLDIPRLEHAGSVSRWVKASLTRFFDNATGGIDGGGWPLGTAPTEDDIAFMLGNAPDLDGIADIKLYENVGDGIERPLPGSIAPTDMIVLDDDPVRIQFQTAEVTV